MREIVTKIEVDDRCGTDSSKTEVPALVEQQETLIVSALYSALLGRSADRIGMEYYKKMLHEQGLEHGLPQIIKDVLVSDEFGSKASRMRGHAEIDWFHSIDLGNGIITKGVKPPEILEMEFDRLGLDGKMLQGKRVLDIGCNDGYFSLRCEELGARVIAIDGVFRDGLKYVFKNLKPKFQFYCMDMMNPVFHELGRFDIILYMGILYHNMFPFEHFVRLANSCAQNALVFIETEYYNLPGSENNPTIFFDYDAELTGDASSPLFPSIKWIERTLTRVGFPEIAVLNPPPAPGGRGRVTVRARYGDGLSGRSPFLFAAEQM
jgi:tRNA (mo5U34)-methyltransferase